MAKRKTSLTNKQKRQLVSLLIAVLIAVLGYIGTSNKLSPNNPIKQVASLVSGKSNNSAKSNGSTSGQSTPQEQLAETVMTSSVKSQLGNAIEWNGAGAYIVNGNKTNLNAKVSSQPYANNQVKWVQGQTVPTVANALKRLDSTKIVKKQGMAQHLGHQLDGIKFTIFQESIAMP